MVGSSALRDITNSVLQGTADQPAAIQRNEPASQPEDTIQVKVRQAIEKVQKQLPDEAVRHITRAKVTYKPIDTGISNIRSSGCKPKSWELNYPALAFLLNGGYYADYASIMGTMGLPVMHHTTWDNLVSWVGTHVEQLAEWSCDQVRSDIVKRGDKAEWTASFDGFYLTRGYHSNTSSATLHDVESDRIAWFTHRTKRGKGSNWEGTSSGAEGDMLDELLRKVKSQGYIVGQIVMDHDTSANAIVCTHFPDIHITYCSNHSAKTFHYELSKIKSLSCKCKKEGKACKHITEALVDRMKAALRNLISCEVLEDSNPLEAFSKGLLNFHSHYCKDQHDSPWCKFHAATNEDGSPYTTKSPLLCSVQSEAFEKLLISMAGKPQEYITAVVAMERLFVRTPLVSLLSSLTIWNMHKVVQEWNSKVQKNNRIQQLVIGFKQDTSHSMAKRLELAGLSYEYLKVQYESMSSQDAFVKWLRSVGVKHKRWHENICTHFKKVFTCKKK